MYFIISAICTGYFFAIIIAIYPSPPIKRKSWFVLCVLWPITLPLFIALQLPRAINDLLNYIEDK